MQIIRIFEIITYKNQKIKQKHTNKHEKIKCIRIKTLRNDIHIHMKVHKHTYNLLLKY